MNRERSRKRGNLEKKDERKERWEQEWRGNAISTLLLKKGMRVFLKY